jgi:hypothetical protein
MRSSLSSSSSSSNNKNGEHPSSSNVSTSRKHRFVSKTAVPWPVAVFAIITIVFVSYWTGTILSSRSSHHRNRTLDDDRTTLDRDAPLITNATPTLPELVRPLVLRRKNTKKENHGKSYWSSSPSSSSSSWKSILSNDNDRNNEHIWEWMIHSVMVTTDPPPKTMAIIVEEEQEEIDNDDVQNHDDEKKEGGHNDDTTTTTILTKNLLNHALMYRSVERVFVVIVTNDDSRRTNDDPMMTAYRTNWTDSSSATVQYVVLNDRNMNLPFQRGEIDVAIALPRLETITEGGQVVFDDDDHDESGEKVDRTPLSSNFWFDYLSSKGIFSTLLGRTYPLDHPTSRRGQATRMGRIDELEVAGFTRIIDYDIPVACSTVSSAARGVPINMGVAFKATNAIARWRMNEAHYQVRLVERLVKDHPQNFDSPILTKLRYPPKHSAVGYCTSFIESTIDDVGSSSTINVQLIEDCSYGQRYNPSIPNIPLTDLYVSKSKAGENSGRGVFTNVDIPKNSYLGLETTVHSILIDWMTSVVHNEMMDYFMDHIPNLAGTIVSVYAEAYGYADEPWGVPQDTVMSHFLTFTNHGCNSTSNIGEQAIPGFNEFTIDVDGPIPDKLQTSISDAYNPVYDRDHEKYLTVCAASEDIAGGGELYDNYLSFGGDTKFKEWILTLRRECSGVPGMVERYQSADGSANLSELFDLHVADDDDDDDDDDYSDRETKGEL